MSTNRLTFDANNIFINMQGLNAAAAHQVVIDLRFGTTQVPEPATIALFGADYFDRLNPEGLRRRLTKRLEGLGFRVTLEPSAQVA